MTETIHKKKKKRVRSKKTPKSEPPENVEISEVPDPSFEELHDKNILTNELTETSEELNPQEKSGNITEISQKVDIEVKKKKKKVRSKSRKTKDTNLVTSEKHDKALNSIIMRLVRIKISLLFKKLSTFRVCGARLCRYFLALKRKLTPTSFDFRNRFPVFGYKIKCILSTVNSVVLNSVVTVKSVVGFLAEQKTTLLTVT